MLENMLMQDITTDEVIRKVILPAMAERMLAEEVWAQTVWPEGEPYLSDSLYEAVRSYKVDLYKLYKEKVLAFVEELVKKQDT
jgi:hypothetical protein